MSQRSKILWRAARLVGLPLNAGLEAIARAVAAKMNRPPAQGKNTRYALLEEALNVLGPPEYRRSTSKKKGKQRAPTFFGDPFLMSKEWRELRYKVLVERGAKCEACGATPADGIRLNVDHIKPRRYFPELSLVQANLQVLCSPCNHGKGAWDMTDWRKHPDAVPVVTQAPPDTVTPLLTDISLERAEAIEKTLQRNRLKELRKQWKMAPRLVKRQG